MKTLHFKTFELALWEWSVRSLKPPKNKNKNKTKKSKLPSNPKTLDCNFLKNSF